MWQSIEILNVFVTLNLKQVFWKTKTFFKNLEYSFSIEDTATENATFPYKPALPKTSVKTNRIGRAKWNYHKEWSFFTNSFFWKFNLSIRTSSINSWFKVLTTQMPPSIFFFNVWVLLLGASSLWLSLIRLYLDLLLRPCSTKLSWKLVKLDAITLFFWSCLESSHWKISQAGQIRIYNQNFASIFWRTSRKISCLFLFPQAL